MNQSKSSNSSPKNFSKLMFRFKSIDCLLRSETFRQSISTRSEESDVYHADYPHAPVSRDIEQEFRIWQKIFLSKCRTAVSPAMAHTQPSAGLLIPLPYMTYKYGKSQRLRHSATYVCIFRLPLRSSFGPKYKDSQSVRRLFRTLRICNTLDPLQTERSSIRNAFPLFSQSVRRLVSLHD